MILNFINFTYVCIYLHMYVCMYLPQDVLRGSTSSSLPSVGELQRSTCLTKRKKNEGLIFGQFCIIHKNYL